MNASILNLIPGFFPSLLMMAAPILIAALGGMVCERSGIVNIGLEGLMSIGAFTAATVHVLMEGKFGLSIPLALLLSAGAGCVFSLIHAYASISLKADQVVSGTGINLLAAGLTIFISQLIFKKERTDAFRLGLLAGPGGIYATAYIALAVWVAVWYLLYKRPFGLRLRACGERPEAAQSAGINVTRMRYFGVLTSGALAGLAGACMMMTQTIQYTGSFINGTGFIALAAVSFGRWLPKGVAGAALLFGGAGALAIYVTNVQFLRDNVPGEIWSSLPYLITFVSLVAFSIGDAKGKRRSKMLKSPA